MIRSYIAAAAKPADGAGGGVRASRFEELSKELEVGVDDELELPDRWEAPLRSFDSDGAGLNGGGDVITFDLSDEFMFPLP